MIFAGAGGHARELYDILLTQNAGEKIYVYEEIHQFSAAKWSNNVYCITDTEILKQHLLNGIHFTPAAGSPLLREKFFNLFCSLGGKPRSVIANTAIISQVNVVMDTALNIMHQVFISNNVTIGKGVLLNTGCKIHHDCVVGEFSEISPGAIITGGCNIGKRCRIGASATILPGIILGDDVVVGAGAVVINNIVSNSTVAGVPARPVYSK